MTFLKALLCGVLIIIAPFELLIPSAIIWIPALGIYLYKIGQRRGTLFIAVIATVVTAAIAIPNAYEQKRFGPFPGNKATLRQLAKTDAVFAPKEIENDVLIALPSSNPTKWEIHSAITNQTSLHARIFRCASGCNLLSGTYSGPISLRD